MRRREFIAGLVCAAASPKLSRAQQAPIPVIGVLGNGSPPRLGDHPVIKGLQEAGFVNGKSARIEQRWAMGDYEKLQALADELVSLRVGVLIALGTPTVAAAKIASAKTNPLVPIVFAMGSDPVAEGFVKSLNRPGGNVTGSTSIAGALAPKRLDLARGLLRDDAAPAILINPANHLSSAEQGETEVAARTIGQRLEVFTARDGNEIEQTFTSIKLRRAGALIIATDNFFSAQARRIAALATQYRVPTIGPFREFADEGCLMSYGPDFAEVNRQAGLMAAKVLRGADAADLPVQQPTKFEVIQ
jgi:putative tryptophan/tyrosine transport system substrate-binding protein